MPQRPRPHVRPINTGASTIRRQSIARRRNIRRTSTTLPSPLRNFVSASDVTSIQSTAGRYRSRNSVSRTSARVQATNEARSTSAEAEKKPLHELFSPRELQTPRALSLDEAIGQSSHAQAHRATLWRRGSETYGKRDDADVFVNPMQAPPTRSKLFAHPNYNKQTVRAIIHSENRSPIGVARQFNIDQLRATVPEATLSPKSEGFDKDALLSAVIASQSGLLSPPDDKTKEKNCQSAKATTVMPIHWEYARASFPILAALMVSPRVRHQDTIDLPLPYPESWPETVGFAYTGQEDFLSERVKSNIRHLGGNV